MANSGKGSDFEREICRLLTIWCGGDPKKPYFWRQPASGAMLTRNDDENMSGDIRSIKPEGDFLTNTMSIELKTGYPKSSFDYHLKYNKSDGIRDFWAQCVGDATKVNKMPLLVYRKKGINPTYIGMDGIMMMKLYDHLISLRFIHVNYPNTGLPDLYMFGHIDFFNTITPEIVKEILC
jgi:hypothetical protein